MKDKIQAILEREIAKLNSMSLASAEPLPSNDIKSLDTLIKAYRTLVDPAKQPPAGSPEKEPEPSRLTNEDLINDILSEPVHG